MRIARRDLLLVAGCIAAAFAAPAEVAADPVVIRVDRGAAAEAQLWLMAAKPSLARNQGSKYKIEMTYFPSADKRFQALEAGALDVITSNAYTALQAASVGVPIKIIASVARETRNGAETRFVVKTESPIRTVRISRDLKGLSCTENCSVPHPHVCFRNWVPVQNRVCLH